MADNEKVFMRAIGNVGRKPARSERREDIIEFSIAQNTGYDESEAHGCQCLGEVVGLVPVGVSYKA